MVSIAPSEGSTRAAVTPVSASFATPPEPVSNWYVESACSSSRFFAIAASRLFHSASALSIS